MAWVYYPPADVSASVRRAREAGGLPRIDFETLPPNTPDGARIWVDGVEVGKLLPLTDDADTSVYVSTPFKNIYGPGIHPDELDAVQCDVIQVVERHHAVRTHGPRTLGTGAAP